jgi:transcriptional regulator with XRE-family HTH domain
MKGSPMPKGSILAIQAIRVERKISQQELADKVKINRALLSQIESGKVIPSFDLLLDIARALDCLITDLYRKDDLEIIKNDTIY